MQRFISFECDVHDVAKKLNEIVNNNEGLYIMDYKTLEGAYGVVVIVEVDKKPTSVLDEFIDMGKELRYDETGC